MLFTVVQVFCKGIDLEESHHAPMTTKGSHISVIVWLKPNRLVKREAKDELNAFDLYV